MAAAVEIAPVARAIPSSMVKAGMSFFMSKNLALAFSQKPGYFEAFLTMPAAFFLKLTWE